MNATARQRSSAHRRAIVGMALLLALSTPSCILAAAAAVGAAAYGAISYHDNEASIDLQGELPTVFDVCRQALRDLHFEVDDTQQPGTTEGTLRAGEATVIVERHPGGMVRVRARVGTFDTDDNERRARLILERVRARL